MLTTGIDKLHLIARDWQESGGVRWTESTQKKWVEGADENTGEITWEQVEKTKKFINDKSTGLRIDNDGIGLFLAFNPNRLLTKSHHIITDPALLPEAVDIARDVCNRHGVDPDFNASILAQVDLCRQAEMNYPIESYQPAFHRLMGSRLENISYEKGYYFKNDNVTAVFYDKAYQARKEYDVKGLPENLQRFEIRVKNHRAVKALMKCNTIQGLTLTDVDSWFTHFAQKRIFNSEKQIALFPHSETLVQYVAGNYRDGVLKFLLDSVAYDKEINSLLDVVDKNFGSLKALRQACMNLGFSRQRWKKTLDSIKARDRFFQKTFLSNKVTPVDLVDELKQKFALIA